MFDACKPMAMSTLKELRNVQLYLIFAKKDSRYYRVMLSFANFA